MASKTLSGPDRVFGSKKALSGPDRVVLNKKTLSGPDRVDRSKNWPVPFPAPPSPLPRTPPTPPGWVWGLELASQTLSGPDKVFRSKNISGPDRVFLSKNWPVPLPAPLSPLPRTPPPRLVGFGAWNWLKKTLSGPDFVFLSKKPQSGPDRVFLSKNWPVPFPSPLPRTTPVWGLELASKTLSGPDRVFGSKKALSGPDSPPPLLVGFGAWNWLQKHYLAQIGFLGAKTPYLADRVFVEQKLARPLPCPPLSPPPHPPPLLVGFGAWNWLQKPYLFQSNKTLSGPDRFFLRKKTLSGPDRVFLSNNWLVPFLAPPSPLPRTPPTLLVGFGAWNWLQKPYLAQIGFFRAKKPYLAQIVFFWSPFPPPPLPHPLVGFGAWNLVSRSGVWVAQVALKMGFGFASAPYGQIDSKKPYLAQIGVFSGFGARFGVQGSGCSQIGLTLCFGLQTGSL